MAACTRSILAEQKRVGASSLCNASGRYHQHNSWSITHQLSQTVGDHRHEPIRHARPESGHRFTKITAQPIALLYSSMQPEACITGLPVLAQCIGQPCRCAIPGRRAICRCRLPVQHSCKHKQDHPPLSTCASQSAGRRTARAKKIRQHGQLDA